MTCDHAAEIAELRARVEALEAALRVNTGVPTDVPASVPTNSQPGKRGRPPTSQEHKKALKAARSARYRETLKSKNKTSPGIKPSTLPSIKTSTDENRTSILPSPQETQKETQKPELNVPEQRVPPLTLPSSQISGEEEEGSSARAREAEPKPETQKESTPDAPKRTPLELTDGTRFDDALQEIAVGSGYRFQVMVSPTVRTRVVETLRDCGVTKADCRLLGEAIARPPSWMRSAQAWQNSPCTMPLLLATGNSPSGDREPLLVHLVNHGRFLELERRREAEAAAQRAKEREKTRVPVAYTPTPGRFAAMLAEQAAARKVKETSGGN